MSFSLSITCSGISSAFKYSSSFPCGAAFDFPYFVIPKNLATNDQYRASIAHAISSSGARVIDEYARPSAHSTGGHFHVDLKGTGVDLGSKKFGGGERVLMTLGIYTRSPSFATARCFPRYLTAEFTATARFVSFTFVSLFSLSKYSFALGLFFSPDYGYNV